MGSQTHRPGAVGGAFGWARLQEGWTVCGARELTVILLGGNLDTMVMLTVHWEGRAVPQVHAQLGHLVGWEERIIQQVAQVSEE